MKRLLGLLLLAAWPAAAQVSMTSAPCNMTDGSCAGIPYNGTTATIRNLTVSGLATPGSITVTPTGTTGATTYTYKLVARLADGTTTEAGAASSTAAGHATLSASNYNALSWSAVSGAASYDVYRTVGGATQGKIVSATTALAVNDTGLAGGGETAPTTDGTGVVTGDRLSLANGSAASPAFSFSASATTGIYRETTGSYAGLAFVVPGTLVFNFLGGTGGATQFAQIKNAGFKSPGQGGYEWSSTSDLTSASDLFLTRSAAATLQLGAANAASPVAQTLKVQDATGSNANAAATFTVKGPAGTGTGTPGAIKFQTAQVGTSGSTAHTQADRLSINSTDVTTNIGTGTATARVGGVLNVNTTSQATTGTSEEVLATYTLPANTLSADGKAIRITVFSSTASNTNTKEFRLKFGGTGGTQVAWQATSAPGASLSLSATIIRTGAATQISTGTSVGYIAASQTLSNNVDIVVTGVTATSAGDLTFRGMIVEALN